MNGTLRLTIACFVVTAMLAACGTDVGDDESAQASRERVVASPDPDAPATTEDPAEGTDSGEEPPSTEDAEPDEEPAPSPTPADTPEEQPDEDPGEEPDEEPEPQDEQEPEDQPEEPDLESVGGYGVNAGHPAAVDAGMQVLEDGGNAVDAAVAAAFAVSVVEPYASGMGGGGAALVHELGEDPTAYDYREVVPATGSIPGTESGVPGFVAGMETLNEAHGEQEFATLLEPATDLAEEGIATTGTVASQLETAAGRLPVGSLPHLYPEGQPLQADQPMVQPELAETLRTLGDHGAQAFYTGAIADAIVEAEPGLDHESLAAYEVLNQEPATGAVGDWEVISAPPPLPGAAFIQQMQVADGMGVDEYAPGSADYIHTMSVVGQLYGHHLNQTLGDPTFVDVPVDELTDPDRSAAVAEQLPGDAPFDPAVLTGDEGAGNTTHLTVVDDQGTIVSMTNTITNFWGAGTFVDGFFLNDHLSRFSVGETDANEPEAGKRPVTYTMPTIVADAEQRPVLGVGSSGGSRIPSILGQIITRWGHHDEPLEAAVEAGRFHTEDGTTMFEEQPDGGVTDELATRGFGTFQDPPTPYYFGSAQALEIDYDAGEVRGAADPRRDADYRIEQP